jgi:hypothetical protein
MVPPGKFKRRAVQYDDGFGRSKNIHLTAPNNEQQDCHKSIKLVLMTAQNHFPDPPAGKTGWPWIETPEVFPENRPDGTPWPRISIVTPSYQQGRYIEETIRSVLLQGYPNLQYWVMDGGSQDETVSILEIYAPWLSGWVSEADKGQAHAINKGWQRSDGVWLGWLNSDDVLLPGSLKAEMEFAANHPQVGFLYGDLWLTNADSSLRSKKIYFEFDLVDFVKNARWISQQGSLIRRDVFEPLDEELHFCMDLDQWIKAALMCPMGYLHRPLACFRFHENSKTSSQSYKAGQDILTIYKKLYERTDLPEGLVRARKQAWASAHLYSAVAWYISRNQSQAWDQLRQAVAADRQVRRRLKFYRILFKLIKGEIRQWMGKN